MTASGIEPAIFRLVAWLVGFYLYNNIYSTSFIFCYRSNSGIKLRNRYDLEVSGNVMVYLILRSASKVCAKVRRFEPGTSRIRRGDNHCTVSFGYVSCRRSVGLSTSMKHQSIIFLMKRRGWNSYAFPDSTPILATVNCGTYSS
jgi:hypothetical protein